MPREETDTTTATAAATTPTPAAFPSDFLWGVATAAPQIEGARATRGDSIWDDFALRRGAIADGTDLDVTCDHVRLMEDDVALVHSIVGDGGVYRFSIAWPRVMPDGMTPSEAGFAFYERLLDALRARNVKAMATLYHWDLPSALEARGGWRSADAPDWFAAYARECFVRLGDRVDWWVTINEPLCVTVLGHVTGVHAPGRTSDPGNEPYVVGHHLLVAHGRAVNALREVEDGTGRRAGVGMALNVEWKFAAGDSADDERACAHDLAFTLGWFAEPLYAGDYPDVMRSRLGDRLPPFTDEERALVQGSCDFFGLNYYTSRLAQFATARNTLRALPSLYAIAKTEARGAARTCLWHLWLSARIRKDGYVHDVGVVPSHRPEWTTTRMGWPEVPAGLTEALVHVTKRYGAPPIFVTENGSAFGDADEARRVTYLHAHLDAVRAALRRGANVRGYMYWSLLDNFEWSFGHARRFGLVRVDFATQARALRPVGVAYRGIARAKA